MIVAPPSGFVAPITQFPDVPLAVTATAAAGSGVTLTLPAVAGQFHFIDSIVITRFAAALLTAAATPVTVTTTNLPGSVAWDFGAGADAQGTIERFALVCDAPLKSSVAGTATTIVCPATTSVIWRVSVLYAISPA